MFVMDTGGLLRAICLSGALSATILTPWRSLRGVGIAICVVVAAVLLWAVALWTTPAGAADISSYKMLSQLRLTGAVDTIHSSHGPLGRVDVVTGGVIHHAPGLSLQFDRPLPAHALMIIDGDQASAVYDCKRREDWLFMDYTTPAVAHHVRRAGRTLIVGAGGGSEIGLALFHGSARVVGLEMNGSVADAMTGPLWARGGSIYGAPGVTVVQREARGYLASGAGGFDIVHLPPLDAFGASGAGLHATQESFLYTVESFSAMLASLSDSGLLCATRWAASPPRGALRVFDTAAEALRRAGLDPRPRLAMIRSWNTVTVLASRTPLSENDSRTVRQFCDKRSFDLCYLPDMGASRVNQHHVLARPYYAEAAEALVGPQRRQYLDGYLFNIAAATDDRPYFFHFLRPGTLDVLAEQIGRRSLAFVEPGYLMLLAAAAQAIVLGAAVILLPLAPGLGALRGAPKKAATLGYFFMLGSGFMLLEMGLLFRLILYLAHPIYSAAAVISSFLLFAGIGSRLSGRWRASPRRIIAVAAGFIIAAALAYVLVLDKWLALTQAAPAPLRFVVVAATVAPLAMAMGQMFPTGLRSILSAAPALGPWAWGVNGFASVVATVAAPLLAMHVGLQKLALIAAACYLVAGLLGRALPCANEAARSASSPGA